MLQNQEVYKQITGILEKLDKELHNVAISDEIVSENEKNFIKLVEQRIPSIQDELDHVFKDDNVTDKERRVLLTHLSSLLEDSIAFCRADARIDEEEVYLIMKLKNELSDIIERLKTTSDNYSE